MTFAPLTPSLSLLIALEDFLFRDILKALFLHFGVDLLVLCATADNRRDCFEQFWMGQRAEIVQCFWKHFSDYLRPEMM